MSVVAKRLDTMPLGTEDDMLWGPSLPPPKKKAEQPHFSAHVCCGQTAGWIKNWAEAYVSIPNEILNHRAAQTFPALASRTKRYQSFIHFGLLHYQ